MRSFGGGRSHRQTRGSPASRSFHPRGSVSSSYAVESPNTGHQQFVFPNAETSPIRPESSMSAASFAPFSPSGDGGVPLWRQYHTPQLGSETPNQDSFPPFNAAAQMKHHSYALVYGQAEQQGGSPRYGPMSAYGPVSESSKDLSNSRTVEQTPLPHDGPPISSFVRPQDMWAADRGYLRSEMGEMSHVRMNDRALAGNYTVQPSFNSTSNSWMSADPINQGGLLNKPMLNRRDSFIPHHGLSLITSPLNSSEIAGNVSYMNSATAEPPRGYTTRAEELAALIISGYFSILDDPALAGPSGKRAASSTVSSNPTLTSRCISQSSPSKTSRETVPSARPRHVKGNPAAFVAVEVKPPPDWFEHVAQGFRPSVEDVLDHLPFIEACRVAMPSDAGVVRINNIPYNTPRSELTAFVGRNAQVVSQPMGSPYFAVHVIMERHSGKAMDAFIELSSPAEAMLVVNQFQRRVDDGRPPRIGDRTVLVELSSQEELMMELFPRAKKVVWDGCIPQVQHEHEEYYPGVPAMGFNGFLQNEEIVMMTRHVESPMRSPFANRCQIRAYESLISTLHKYPWFALEHVSMNERRSLYEATLTSVRALINFLRRGEGSYDRTKPTVATLQELVVACLTCPGFSEQQKMGVVMLCHHGGFTKVTNARGMNLAFGGTFPLATVWPFQALVKAPGVSDLFMTYIACLLCEATTSSRNNTPATTNDPFGPLQINYDHVQTMEQAGHAELHAIEAALSRILPRSRTATRSSSETPLRPSRTAWSASVGSSSRDSFTTYSA